MTGCTRQRLAGRRGPMRDLAGRHGFYTVEAAIFLPLVILAVLTIGYFVRTDAVWENVMHGALDECSYSAATCSSGPGGSVARKRVLQRVNRDNPGLSEVSVAGGVTDLAGGVTDVAGSLGAAGVSSGLGLADTYNTCRISGTVSTALPLGFGRNYTFEGRIKYRDFTGVKYAEDGMGAEGLETSELSDPVWIFPQSGTKYHSEKCTHVKATVHSCILTDSVKRRYSSCGLCHSGKLSNGAIVFCFNGEDTSYHRGRCRSIRRHTIVIDKSEATKKGYTPCSKCGGG